MPFFIIASKRRYNDVLVSNPQCIQIQSHMRKSIARSSPLIPG
jgi:hypothetical protein